MRYRISIQSFTLIWLLEYFSGVKKTSRQRDWETYGWQRERNMLSRHLHTIFFTSLPETFSTSQKGTTVSRVRFTPFPSSRSSLEGARSRGARCSQKKRKKFFKKRRKKRRKNWISWGGRTKDPSKEKTQTTVARSSAYLKTYWRGWRVKRKIQLSP